MNSFDTGRTAQLETGREPHIFVRQVQEGQQINAVFLVSRSMVAETRRIRSGRIERKGVYHSWNGFQASASGTTNGTSAANAGAYPGFAPGQSTGNGANEIGRAHV